MITFKQINQESIVLSSEGTQIASQGSHEFLVWSSLPSLSTSSSDSVGLTAKQIEENVGKDVAKVGQGKAMKNKWIVKKGDTFVRAVRYNSLSLCTRKERC